MFLNLRNRKLMRRHAAASLQGTAVAFRRGRKKSPTGSLRFVRAVRGSSELPDKLNAWRMHLA
jgi:hypothetical protein